MESRIGFGARREIVDTRKAVQLGITLAFLQLADGYLTLIGVTRFGTGAEGNPLLRHLIEEFGPVQILTVVKLFAIFLIGTLTYYAQSQLWVRSAMGAVSFIYVVGAIIPWTYILFIKPHL